jgi:hypothetical protein
MKTKCCAPFTCSAFHLHALTLALVLGSAAPGLAVEAEPGDNAHVWQPRVTSVAVFKNGLGFFLREGAADLRDGWCLAGEVPPAHFGTLAIYAHGKDELVDIVGSGPGEVIEFDGQDAPKDTTAKVARLNACRQLKVQLTYTQKDVDRTAAGKLVSVGPDFAVLESETSTFAVPLAGLKRLQVLELPLRVHVAGATATPPARATLGMAYLRKGITWIPEYTLKLLDDTTAELTLRGTLVNEAEDLIHCDVNFVVGVPNFLHTDFLAPVAVGQIIRSIGAAVAPREVMTQIANRAALATDQRADQFAVGDRPAGGAGRDVKEVLGNLPQLDGPGGADFTVYTKKDLTVRRGEKAIVTLFTKRIAYGHIFRWSPPETIRHYLVLKNDTDSAWTTGAMSRAESRQSTERRPAVLCAQGRQRGTAGDHGHQCGPRPAGDRDRPQTQGARAGAPVLCGPHHARRRAAGAELRADRGDAGGSRPGARQAHRGVGGRHAALGPDEAPIAGPRGHVRVAAETRARRGEDTDLHLRALRAVAVRPGSKALQGDV